MLKNHWFYYVFARKCWKTIGFSVLSRKKVEKALVLLRFRSKMLKNHWFYCVFAQKGWKTIGFTVFSLKSIEKALVLLCFRSKRLKNHWFYCKNAKKWKNQWFYSEQFKKRAKTSIKPMVFFEQKGRKTNFGLRIRALGLQYSSGDVMRNPYRQAV